MLVVGTVLLVFALLGAPLFSVIAASALVGCVTLLAALAGCGPDAPPPELLRAANEFLCDQFAAAVDAMAG